MPITDDKIKAKIFMLLGVPDKATARGFLALATISGPAGELFTLTEIQTQIVAALAATNASEDAIISTDSPNIIGEFDKIYLKETEITEDQGTSGPSVFSVEKRMEVLRQRLANILGIYIPRGGFHRAFDRIANSNPEFSTGPTR